MEEIRLIDANALKEDLKHYFTDGVLAGVSAKLTFNQILHDIDNAPTITPTLPTEVKKALEVLKVMKQGKWVPVSEQLPPNYILCLFCDKDGNIFYGHRKTNNLWYEEFQPGNVSDVVAWQELPEPYKEGGAEE